MSLHLPRHRANPCIGNISELLVGFRLAQLPTHALTATWCTQLKYNYFPLEITTTKTAAGNCGLWRSSSECTPPSGVASFALLVVHSLRDAAFHQIPPFDVMSSYSHFVCSRLSNYLTNNDLDSNDYLFRLLFLLYCMTLRYLYVLRLIKHHYY